MFRKNLSSKVSITEQDLYDLSCEIINRVHPEDPTKFRNIIKSEVSRKFNILESINKTKASWFHEYSGELFLVAAISTIAITGKIAIEQYFGGR